jgi:uncharacterized protein (DUF924 family)
LARGILTHAYLDGKAVNAVAAGAEIERIERFWRAAGPERWFAKDDDFDARVRREWLDLHFAAARRELDGWLESAAGALALLLLLDQVPRNALRGTAHMFATDPLARSFAQRAVAAGLDRDVTPDLRVFVYMPFEHSEDLADQERAVELIRPLGAFYERYAIEHRDIIRRFGRFPHRNALLGRDTTAEERAFLESGGFAG